jgi:hypothetical protein
MEVHPSVRTDQERASCICPYCRASLAEAEGWRCPSCATPHHLECARENGRCTVMGCANVAPGVARWGESRFLREAVLFTGLGAVLAFALRFSTLNGESGNDPVIVSVFFVGITIWGTVFDHTRRRRREAAV